MSNDVNTAILERIGEEVAELTQTQLLEELGLKGIGNDPMDYMPAWRRVELEERLSKQRWEEYPEGPA